MNKPSPVSTTNRDESDAVQRIGTSPRLIAAPSIYLQKDGKYHVNFADHVKPLKTKSAKEAHDALSKFLKEQLDQDVFEEGEE